MGYLRAHQVRGHASCPECGCRLAVAAGRIVATPLDPLCKCGHPASEHLSPPGEAFCTNPYGDGLEDVGSSGSCLCNKFRLAADQDGAA